MSFTGMFHAAGYVSPGIATVVANTQPLLAAGPEAVVLGERMSNGGEAGLFLGFSGIVTMAFPRLFAGGRDSCVIGLVHIIRAALGVAVGNVILKRIAVVVDPLMAFGVQPMIGSVALALLDLRWSMSSASHRLCGAPVVAGGHDDAEPQIGLRLKIQGSKVI